MKKLLNKLLLLSLFTIPVMSSAATCGSTAVCKTPSILLNNASGNTPQILYTATGNGAKIIGVYCVGTQTSPAVNIIASALHSGITTSLFINAIASSYGNFNALTYYGQGNGNTIVNGLHTDETGNYYLLLGSGDSLQINVVGAVISGANTITCEAEIVQY
jgi:hypothetical protein